MNGAGSFAVLSNHPSFQTVASLPSAKNECSDDRLGSKTRLNSIHTSFSGCRLPSRRVSSSSGVGRGTRSGCQSEPGCPRSWSSASFAVANAIYDRVRLHKDRSVLHLLTLAHLIGCATARTPLRSQ